MICFHLGYPKAASTTLQKCVFNRHSQIINLGLYPQANIGRDMPSDPAPPAPFLCDPELRVLHDLLTKTDGISYQDDQALELWRSLTERYTEDGKTIVFSNEGLLSVRFSNPEVLEKCRRIHQLCPGAKILIIIRSQLELLKSLYRDHPFDPRTLQHRPKPVSFSEFLDIDLRADLHSHANSLHFDRTLDKLSSLFGENNILMLPLELLMHSTAQFSTQIARFLGIDGEEVLSNLQSCHENKGATQALNRYRSVRQFLSALMPRLPFLTPTMESLDRKLRGFYSTLGNTADIRSTPEDVQRINKRFAQGNAILENKLALSLKNLGYPTSKDYNDFASNITDI